MSEQKTDTAAPEATSAPTATVNLADFGQVIGDAVAKGIAANTRRKITQGEYNARGGHSPFHPDPKKRLKFNRVYSQNGRICELATTYDDEIELLNQITHSGRYIDRLVEVVVSQDGSEEVVDFRFSNKTQYAFELKGKAKDFTEILRQIVAAQTAERAEEEETRNERSNRRHFGNSKASQAARDKAGV